MEQESSGQLLELSDEILINIISFVTPKQLLRLRQTCHRLRNLGSDDRLWENLLNRHYGLERTDLWEGWSAEEIYKAVHRYRELLGLWLCEMRHFGLLVNIAVEQGGMVAYEYSPPLDDNIMNSEIIQKSFTPVSGVDYANIQRLHNFRFRRLFALSPERAPNQSTDPHRFLRFLCYQSSRGGHVADGNETEQSVVNEAEMSHCLQKTENGFTFICENKTEHTPVDLQYWIEWEHGIRMEVDDETVLSSVLSALEDEHCYDLRVEKYQAKSELDRFCLSRCVEYRLPEFGPPVKIEPPHNRTYLSVSPSVTTFPKISTGLYFGHFAWHGWEVLDISYSPDRCLVIGTKVTGDQMVPVGKTSFRVHLLRRINLRYEDQATVCTVRAALNTMVIPIPSATDIESHNWNAYAVNGQTPPEPPFYRFRVPNDCSILGTSSVPEYCLHFFMAEGQIAFPNFCNPRYLNCVFVVFNPQQVGLLWLDLKCFMPLYKVSNL